MANEELKTRITGWADAADDLQLVEERSAANADFALQLRSAPDGVDVEVTAPTGEDRILLSHTAPPDRLLDDHELARLVEGRPGTISAAAGNGAGGERTVALRTWVYLDGLTKQSFMSAIGEIVRTRQVLDRATGHAHAVAPAASPAATPAPEPVAAAIPEPVAAATPSPAVAPAAMPQPVPQPAYAAQPAPQPYVPQPAPQPAPQPVAPAAAGGWTPTHKVPGQGMQAWAAPDPNGAVVANLGGNLPVQVAETRGAWANVICSNGWTGWVDARLLVVGG